MWAQFAGCRGLPTILQQAAGRSGLAAAGSAPFRGGWIIACLPGPGGLRSVTDGGFRLAVPIGD
jgi:hypothetical protein